MAPARRARPALALIAVGLALLGAWRYPVASAGPAAPGRVAILDASPHLWYRMAEALVERLYDPSLGLFRETWGTPEGRCWYWNTEQGEAAQVVVHLDNATLLTDMLAGYRRYLTYDNGTSVYLFTRYTPCSMIRALSTDPRNFSLGNLIVNVGGDLSGTRTDNGNYSRAIAISLDIYKDYTNIYEQDKAWPNLWYTANLKAPEVWYRSPGDTGDYRGIWDTSDGSLGAGRIVDYHISYNSTYAEAVRVMSDARLVYEQHFILEPRKPYVKVLLVVRNNSTDNLSDVRVSLAFDNMDWWLYQVAYLPGIGYINASTSGKKISDTEKEYHLAYSWDGKWEPVNGWWIAVFYSNRPIGMNRGLAVMVNASYGVHLWGYGNLQSPQKDLYGIPAFTDWYFRWMKFEIKIGNLAPGESRTVEVRIVPMASYAPGLERLYVEMLSKIDQLDGRDFSYAVNTGTGAFGGLAEAAASLGASSYGLLLGAVETAGRVMEGWGWRVSTRVLANYIQALVALYESSGDETLLEEARRAAGALLSAQVRDPGDPRDGGFLDAPPPLGIAAYLDVGAEATLALLALYNATGDESYLDAVQYWLDRWFHHDEATGSWYYHIYRSPREAPGGRWYVGRLDGEPPYALGYLLQALSSLYWDDPRLGEAASTLWSLLEAGYWVATSSGAGESNVETQSSAAAGLRAYLNSLAEHAGAGVEYVRGATLRSLDCMGGPSGRAPPAGGAAEATLHIEVERRGAGPSVVAVYIPRGTVEAVHEGGARLPAASSLDGLAAAGSAYYWDPASRILYVKLTSSGRLSVACRLEAPHTSETGGPGPTGGATNTSWASRPPSSPSPPQPGDTAALAAPAVALALLAWLAWRLLGRTQTRPRPLEGDGEGGGAMRKPGGAESLQGREGAWP